MTGIRHLYLNCTGISDRSTEVSPLEREFHLRGAPYLLASPLRTLLVAGDSPFPIGLDEVDSIRRLLTPRFLDGIEEWTVETGAGEVTPDLLRGWRDAGVTRPHLRLLSLSASVLSWIGDAEEPATKLQALDCLKRAGSPSWGVDLLFGLPGTVDPDPVSTAHAAVAAGSPHISLYEYVAGETEMPGSRGPREGERPPSEEEKAELYLRIANFLLAEGYDAYEMTGFALPGHHSRHARGVLEGGDYLGLGPGAESFMNGRLSRNFTDRLEYSRHLAAGGTPEYEVTELERNDLRFLRLWSRLRLAEGVPAEELTDAGRSLCEEWVRAGLARRDPARVALTSEGWLRLDGLAIELAETLPVGDTDVEDD